MVLRKYIFWLVWALILLPACNLKDVAGHDATDVSAEDVSDSVTDSASDVANDTDDAEDGDVCRDAETLCGSDCVDVQTSLDHCGECERACEAPNATPSACLDGQCEFNCEDGFVDINEDLNDPEGDGCESECEPVEGVEEICDRKDNDCDGTVDEGVIQTWYLDTDSDGYGQDVDPKMGCDRPSPRYVGTGGDCDDSDATISPGATETCDGIDNDCDNVVDEGVKTTYYRDEDGDGYGSTVSEEACSAPVDYVLEGGDCDDREPDAFPGQTEYFFEERETGGFDYNCDGSEDLQVNRVSSGLCEYYGACGRTASRCRPGNGSVGWRDTLPSCGEEAPFFVDCQSCVARIGSCQNMAVYQNQTAACR